MPKGPIKVIQDPIQQADLWAVVKKHLDKMSDAERVDTLKSAGILTRSGSVARPYARVIRKISPASK